MFQIERQSFIEKLRLFHEKKPPFERKGNFLGNIIDLFRFWSMEKSINLGEQLPIILKVFLQETFAQSNKHIHAKMCEK